MIKRLLIFAAIISILIIGAFLYRRYRSAKDCTSTEDCNLAKDSVPNIDDSVVNPIQTESKVDEQQISTVKTRAESIDQNQNNNNDYMSEINNIDFDPQDKHNVHNSSIRTNIRNKIDLLIKSYKAQPHNRITLHETIIQIDQANKSRGDRYKNLRPVLEYMYNQKYHYAPLDIKELILLVLIWNRIMHPKNQQKQNVLTEDLLFQIDDCQQSSEPNDVYCPEGRIVRLLQALDTSDYQPELWKTVPLWAYKYEIQNVTAVKMNDMVDNLSPSDQLIYIKSHPDANEQEKIDKWNNDLIKQLDRQFTKEYVDTELLDQDQLFAITEPCYNALKSCD